MVERHERPAAAHARAILVVDDDADVRRCICRLLERANHVVHAASDGVEALVRHAEVGTDLALVLLDLSMPRMDGVATLRELRKRGAIMPVLICSSAVTPAQKSELDQLGVAGYLSKPFPLGELLGAINLVLTVR